MTRSDTLKPQSLALTKDNVTPLRLFWLATLSMVLVVSQSLMVQGRKETMPVLRETEFVAEITWLGHVPQETGGLRSVADQALTLGFDGVTTGASNDIKRATELSRSMVTKWGLSAKLGPLMYDEDSEEVFLGRSAGSPAKVFAPETAQRIDEEIRKIIDDCYAAAEKVLVDNMDKLHMMADALMKYETIDSGQIDDIMEGNEPRPPKGWGDGEPKGPASKGGANSETQASSKDDIGDAAGEH